MTRKSESAPVRARPKRQRSRPAVGPQAVGQEAGASAKASGVLLVVVGAEGRGKEMLVAIARRRFEADASLEFPARVTTRGFGAASGDLPVSRREFRDLAEAGAFICQWETGGQSFGLGVAARRSLEEGRTVVVVAGREAVERLRGVWADVRVVEVKAGPDTILGPRGNAGGGLSVHHQGDVAAAVRRFHEIIVGMRLERLAEGPPVAGKGLRAAMLKGVAAARPGTSGLRGLRHRA